MTAQLMETLYYKGEKFGMATEPLKEYLQTRSDIKFLPRIESWCWRQYVGEWEIKNGKLYLIELHGMLAGPKKFTVDSLFPGRKTAFAHWFSGEIRVPQGEMIEYVHLGYESIYERDLFLAFEKGLLIGEHVMDNKGKRSIWNSKK